MLTSWSLCISTDLNFFFLTKHKVVVKSETSNKSWGTESALSSTLKGKHHFGIKQ